jgi:benzodiazapine receptor
MNSPRLSFHGHEDPIVHGPQVPLSTGQQIAGLVIWLGLTFVAAAVGSIASIEAPAFYAQLALPEWAPPAWLFGPVWSVLYLLMGLAAWLVWRTGGFRHSGLALQLYLVQLAANALWSWLFFAWRKGALASAEIVILWLLILGTTASFWRVHRAAALLMIPYVAWVAFATMLCITLWKMNPHLLG